MSKRILLGLVLGVYFIFGFYHLTNFISADEHFWLPNSGAERIEEYWKAIREGNWKNTRINDKPGITLAYTSGIALLFDDASGQIVEKDNTFKRFDPERTKKINFLYRLPILLLSGFFSLFFFWIIKKITKDGWIALWSVTGMLLSPVLLGISQIVNPDSLFWIFGSSTLFSFYAFLQERQKKFAILTALFFGLGLASKYVTIIFLPFFFLMMLIFYFFELETWREKRLEFQKFVLGNSLSYLGIILSGFLLFAVLMPASFVELEFFYLGTIGFPGMAPIFWATMVLNLAVIADAWFFKGRGLFYSLEKLRPFKKHISKIVYFILGGTVFFVIINWLTRNSIIDLSDIPFDTKRRDSFSEIAYYRRFIIEFVPLVFSLTPVALFALLFVWLKSFFCEIRLKTFVFVLSTFFLVFYVAVIEQGLLVTVRYSIVLFPFVMVLGAIALSEFFSKKNETESRWLKIVSSIIFSAIGILFILSQIQQTYFDGPLKKLFVNRVFRNPLSIIAIIFVIWLIAKLVRKYAHWQRREKISRVWIFSGLALLNVISLYLCAPFYFSYTNRLLPKSYIISGAWGYGGYEMAQYLNALPDAKNLIVWADSYGLCEFFVGKCIHKEKVDTVKYPIDYYFQSLQATIGMRFPNPKEEDSTKTILINDRPKSFLKLYKALK
jgi:4-amino-4-deoxy-L-arabinose transferase-like glycosyltransferase